MGICWAGCRRSDAVPSGKNKLFFKRAVILHGRNKTSVSDGDFTAPVISGLPHPPYKPGRFMSLCYCVCEAGFLFWTSLPPHKMLNCSFITYRYCLEKRQFLSTGNFCSFFFPVCSFLKINISFPLFLKSWFDCTAVAQKLLYYFFPEATPFTWPIVH